MKFLVECIKNLPYLEYLKLLFTMNSLGGNVENIMYISDMIKHLPRKLKQFTLDLSWNTLGANVDNMKILAESIIWLPNNLKNLELNLSDNNLVENV